jgi:hypothetical protein
MDELVKKIAAFGTPGLVLIIAMASTGLSGAAALTAALAALGPFGMMGGILLLGFIALSADKITEYGFEAIAKAVVKEQLKTYSKADMLNKVDNFIMTKGMKLKIKEFIENC